MRLLFLAATLLVACGGSGGGNTPVDVTVGSLDGYWVVSSPETWGPRPGLVHFGVDAWADEVPAGATNVAEVVRMLSGESEVVLYELEGKTVTFTNPLGETTTLTIESLTRDEMVAAVGGIPVTLTRQTDCAGPGFWMGGLRVVDAAWDPFGGLHIIGSRDGGADRYGWVAPGRCVITWPETLLTGASVDVGDDGDIRLLNYARSGALPGEVTVTIIPAKPWARGSLDQARRIYPAPSTPASDPPPLRSIEVEGELIVFYAYGNQLFAVDDEAETALTLTTSSTFTPALLTATRLPDGSWVIREGNGSQGLRYVDGAYEPWSAEKIDDDGRLASVFAYDGDTLYAAWSEAVANSTPALIVAKKVGGAWQQVTAGAGYPSAIRVEDGAIDVIGVLDDRWLGPMAWTHLPRFEDNVWQQEYQLGFDGTIDTVRVRAGAASGLFGPNGEVFMAVEHGVWRRPHAEKKGETYHWTEIELTFQTETDAAVTFPTLGQRCEASCTFAAPTSALFPAVVELLGESAASRLVGGRTTPTENSYAVQANPVVITDAGPTQLRLETTLRRLDPIALGADEVQSTSGVAVAYDRGFAVTRSFGTVFLSKVEDGAVVDEVELYGEPGRLHARPGGGFVMSLMPPTVAAAAVGLLSPQLELEAEIPLPGQVRAYALTDEGFIAFAYDGPNLVLAEHTSTGVTPSVASPLSEPIDIATLGDGIVAFEPQDRGVAPTFAGDPSRSVWRKLGADGVIDWTLAAQRNAALVWSVAAGDLIVAGPIGASFTIGGETYSGVTPPDDATPIWFLGRFDGATGLLKQHRVVTGTGIRTDVPPANVTADDSGVLVSSSFGPTTVMVAHFPWGDDAITNRQYSADVIGGFCLQPGTECATNDIAFAALGGGRFGGVWTQITTTLYDGETVVSAAKKAVAGVFTPHP
jgi:hypothetical protein